MWKGINMVFDYFYKPVRLFRLALFMWSLDYYKIAYFQYDFCKESCKINTSHMAHIKKCLFFNVFSIYGVRKMTYFRCAWSGHMGFLMEQIIN